MKVILVNGSPHKEGCTYTALKEVEKTLNHEGIDTEMFWIGLTPISGCSGCGICKKRGKCVHDDVVNQFVSKASDADAFFFGTPVHYASASGAMTSFMDRVFYSGNSKGVFTYKPAATIISARRAGTTATYDQMNKYYGISQMPIISSRYWNMVHGSNPSDVLKDEVGMQTMRILGRNMAYFLKCIEAGNKVGIKMPEKEILMFTNFIRE